MYGKKIIVLDFNLGIGTVCISLLWVIIIIIFCSFVLNPMLPSICIARGYYRFSPRGWANFRCISSQFGRSINPICMFTARLNHPLSKPWFAVPGVKNCTSMLGPVLKEKSCLGKVGHPSNHVNFSEPLREKKSWPLHPSQQCSRACSSKTGLAHALIVSPWPSWPSWVSWVKSWPA